MSVEFSEKGVEILELEEIQFLNESRNIRMMVLGHLSKIDVILQDHVPDQTREVLENLTMV